MEFTPDQLIGKGDLVTKAMYNKLKKKYKEQQKALNALKMEEKLALRADFNAAKAGRKRKYTPLRMQNRIIDYFATVLSKNKPPTISGLMNHLHMNRDQFYTYEKYPEFKDIMEKTRNMMENWLEESLIMGRGNPQGIQFTLKNRFGWADTQVIRHETDTNEDHLIRKIEALAPDLIGFFKATGKILHQIPETIEAEVIDIKRGE